MKTFFFIVGILLPFHCISQNYTSHSIANKGLKNLSIQAQYQKGHVFGTNDFLKGNNEGKNKINTFQSFAIQLSKQTTGQQKWQQLFNYPTLGFGCYTADFYNPKELGQPFALYGFFNAPFKRWDKWSLNYECRLGATFNWQAYNPIDNQYNISIGAASSFLIDLGLSMKHVLGEHLELETGLSLTHFSNGALQMPNKGINTIAPKINLFYNFHDRPEFHKTDLPKFEKQNEWFLSIFGGAKNVIFERVNIDILEKYEGVHFPVLGLSTIFNRQISYKSKIGLGMSFSYNGSINGQIEIEEGEIERDNKIIKDKWQLSIYPSYEFVIHRVSVILQPAFYLYRQKTAHQSPIFHQRIGLKYHISKDFFISFILRDYDFHVSDFIEWHAGYKIDWKRKN